MTDLVERRDIIARFLHAEMFDDPEYLDTTAYRMADRLIAALDAQRAGLEATSMREALRDANAIIERTRRHLAEDHPGCAYTVLGILNDGDRAALASEPQPASDLALCDAQDEAGRVCLLYAGHTVPHRDGPHRWTADARALASEPQP